VAKKLHKVHSVKQFFSLILKVNKNENGSDFEFGTISLLRIIMRFLRKLFLIWPFMAGAILRILKHNQKPKIDIF